MPEARAAEQAVSTASRIDLLYVSWNRLEFTKASFAALCANTTWERVARLWLADDASSDGTREHLEDAAGALALACGVDVAFLPAPFHGPVQAAARYLPKRSAGAEAFAKIDNDTIMPPGWLEELLGLLERHPDIDLLGVRADKGPPEPCPLKRRGVRYADFVDGNGLWRHRAFDGRPAPRSRGPRRRHGFSEWQVRNKDVVKAWAEPDLPVFQLDNLPLEPWLGLSAGYARKGWQRGWPNALYNKGANAYWDWWLAASGNALGSAA